LAIKEETLEVLYISMIVTKTRNVWCAWQECIFCSWWSCAAWNWQSRCS